MNNATFEKVCQTAADVFDVSAKTLTMQSSPDSIQSWDSLNHVNFVIALEQEFEVEFLPEEVAEMLSLEKVVSIIENKNSGR